MSKYIKDAILLQIYQNIFIKFANKYGKLKISKLIKRL